MTELNRQRQELEWALVDLQQGLPPDEDLVPGLLLMLEQLREDRLGLVASEALDELLRRITEALEEQAPALFDRHRAGLTELRLRAAARVLVRDTLVRWSLGPPAPLPLPVIQATLGLEACPELPPQPTLWDVVHALAHHPDTPPAVAEELHREARRRDHTWPIVGVLVSDRVPRPLLARVEVRNTHAADYRLLGHLPADAAFHEEFERARRAVSRLLERLGVPPLPERPGLEVRLGGLARTGFLAGPSLGLPLALALLHQLLGSPPLPQRSVVATGRLVIEGDTVHVRAVGGARTKSASLELDWVDALICPADSGFAHAQAPAVVEVTTLDQACAAVFGDGALQRLVRSAVAEGLAELQEQWRRCTGAPAPRPDPLLRRLASLDCRALALGCASEDRARAAVADLVDRPPSGAAVVPLVPAMLQEQDGLLSALSPVWQGMDPGLTHRSQLAMLARLQPIAPGGRLVVVLHGLGPEAGERVWQLVAGLAAATDSGGPAVVVVGGSTGALQTLPPVGGRPWRQRLLPEGWRLRSTWLPGDRPPPPALGGLPWSTRRARSASAAAAQLALVSLFGWALSRDTGGVPPERVQSWLAQTHTLVEGADTPARAASRCTAATEELAELLATTNRPALQRAAWSELGTLCDTVGAAPSARRAWLRALALTSAGPERDRLRAKLGAQLADQHEWTALGTLLGPLPRSPEPPAVAALRARHQAATWQLRALAATPPEQAVHAPPSLRAQAGALEGLAGLTGTGLEGHRVAAENGRVVLVDGDGWRMVRPRAAPPLQELDQATWAETVAALPDPADSALLAALASRDAPDHVLIGAQDVVVQWQSEVGGDRHLTLWMQIIGDELHPRGTVHSAVFADLQRWDGDGDGEPELWLAGHKQERRLVRLVEAPRLELVPGPVSGSLLNALEPVDIDGDGQDELAVLAGEFRAYAVELLAAAPGGPQVVHRRFMDGLPGAALAVPAGDREELWVGVGQKMPDPLLFGEDHPRGRARLAALRQQPDGSLTERPLLPEGLPPALRSTETEVRMDRLLRVDLDGDTTPELLVALKVRGRPGGTLLLRQNADQLADPVWLEGRPALARAGSGGALLWSRSTGRRTALELSGQPQGSDDPQPPPPAPRPSPDPRDSAAWEIALLIDALGDDTAPEIWSELGRRARSTAVSEAARLAELDWHLRRGDLLRARRTLPTMPQTPTVAHHQDQLWQRLHGLWSLGPDHPPRALASQAVAAEQLQTSHPGLLRTWSDGSPGLVLLGASDDEACVQLTEQADAPLRGLRAELSPEVLEWGGDLQLQLLDASGAPVFHAGLSGEGAAGAIEHKLWCRGLPKSAAPGVKETGARGLLGRAWRLTLSTDPQRRSLLCAIEEQVGEDWVMRALRTHQSDGPLPALAGVRIRSDGPVSDRQAVAVKLHNIELFGLQSTPRSCVQPRPPLDRRSALLDALRRDEPGALARAHAALSPLDFGLLVADDLQKLADHNTLRLELAAERVDDALRELRDDGPDGHGARVLLELWRGQIALRMLQEGVTAAQDPNTLVAALREARAAARAEAGSTGAPDQPRSGQWWADLARRAAWQVVELQARLDPLWGSGPGADPELRADLATLCATGGPRVGERLERLLRVQGRTVGAGVLGSCTGGAGG